MPLPPMKGDVPQGLPGDLMAAGRQMNAAGRSLVRRAHYNNRNETVCADYAVDITAGGDFNGIDSGGREALNAIATIRPVAATR